jgi:hypothetical protein
MKRTTIFIPETLERDLQLYARREGRAVASVVREAVERYLTGAAAAGVRLPSFAGVAASGRRDIAERHEEILFGALQPHDDRVAAKPARYTHPTRARRSISRRGR